MHSVCRLVTFTIIATEYRWRSIHKAKALLVTFCLWFAVVVEVAEIAAHA